MTCNPLSEQEQLMEEIDALTRKVNRSTKKLTKELESIRWDE